MNEEIKQQILDIFDDEVELKDPINREKQAIIKELLIETLMIEGINNDNKEQY